MAIKKNNKKNLTSEQKKTEKVFENSLRPKNLKEYIGQEQIKNNLKVFISAAKGRKEPLGHLLFFGPPGLGKTSLSNVISKEMDSNMKITAGPILTKTGELVSILSSLKKGDILFIDEIHRLKQNLEEVLYSAMEDFKIDIIMGKGPSARSMTLNLEKFTLIGATTKVGKLSAPLRDRFGNIFRLDFYTKEEIKIILEKNAEVLGIKIDEKSLEKIALTSRFVPRIANRLLSSLRDFAEVENDGFLDEKTTLFGLKSIGVSNSGLDKSDILYLENLINKFEGGPVGVGNLAVSMHEEIASLEDYIEPFLIQNGFLKRTQQGRLATQKAFDFLKKV